MGIRSVWRIRTALLRAVLGFSFVFACRGQSMPSRMLTGKSRQAVRSRLQQPPSQRTELGRAPTFHIGRITDAERHKPVPSPSVIRVGVNRALASTSLADGQWQTASDGSPVWRLDIQSEGALGIRLHFLNFSVGSGQVWLHDTGSPARQIFGPYTDRGRNNDGSFWTEAIFSDTVEVEYQPASGFSSEGHPPFGISELTHLWQLGPYTSALQGGSTGGTQPEGGIIKATGSVPNLSCFKDIACEATGAPDDLAARTTAYLEFNGVSCSGTLLNAPNGEPLILTAGHCINNETDARAAVAIFNYRSARCSQFATDLINGIELADMAQSNGVHLLSYSNEPFLTTQPNDASYSPAESDLDYSLLQLDQFPAFGNIVLAGYSAEDLPLGYPLWSVSHPLGLPLAVAYGYNYYSLFLNAWGVAYRGDGRVDHGSSGSGIFDISNRLVGVLSTAEEPPDPNGTSCDVTNQLYTNYTKFAPIYGQIKDFLNKPLPQFSNLPVNASVFHASPNPIDVVDGSGFGQTTLYVNAPAGVRFVEIHLGYPNGPLLSYTSAVAAVPTGKWVTDGMVFYLQDVSQGQSRTLDHTLATITANFSKVSFEARPSYVLASGSPPLGQTTLAWNAPNASRVAIRIGSPTGALMALMPSAGEAPTGRWVTDGMPFYLLDASNGLDGDPVLGMLTVQVGADSAATGATQSGYIFASPNPIPVPLGEIYGTTTLTWNSGNASIAEVHIGSPDGPLFARTRGSWTASTGQWVTDGMVFYLEDVSSGVPFMLATTTVHLAH
ncbi:MAG TPA: trypsin-like peptidase domain-containing protein [Bryobacteraceae bacterium]|nr:trypsin-like peptidase domain-containing protein [Bryobacteraceae bacterium]